MKKIDISCIILTWNSAQHISTCIEGLVNDLKKSSISFEIIVVDNGSTDKSPKILSEFKKNIPQLNVITLPENKGTTYSRNIGMKTAKGEYILILDSDIIFKESNTVKRLLNVVQEKKDCGIVGPYLSYKNGKYQKSFDKYPTLSAKIKRIFSLRNMEVTEADKILNLQAPIKVEYLISAFWIFKAEHIKKAGYLDEKIFYAPEDAEYCLRVTKNCGTQNYFIPNIKVIHNAQEITRKKIFSKMSMSHLKGLIYFNIKYFGYLYLKLR